MCVDPDAVTPARARASDALVSATPSFSARDDPRARSGATPSSFYPVVERAGGAHAPPLQWQVFGRAPFGGAGTHGGATARQGMGGHEYFKFGAGSAAQDAYDRASVDRLLQTARRNSIYAATPLFNRGSNKLKNEKQDEYLERQEQTHHPSHARIEEEAVCWAASASQLLGRPDYRLRLLTESDVTSVIQIEQIHMDHFVEGDIPVIFKNTSPSNPALSDVFLHLGVKRALVDPRHAPVYDEIDVRVSPMSANIELLVIEQLIQIAEKEAQLLAAQGLAGSQGAYQSPAKLSATGCAGSMALIAKRWEKEALGSAVVSPPAPSHGSSPDRQLPQIFIRAPAAGLGGAKRGGGAVAFHHLTVENSSHTFFASPRIFQASQNSHLFIAPIPRWIELKAAAPVFLKSLNVDAMGLTVSIRTSEHRISRQVLHIVDSLPLDTPYMSIQIGSERRRYMVCSWGELMQSLRNSYLRQFIRQSLPSAWMSNPFAFVMGVLRGIRALWMQTFRGATRDRRARTEGVLSGLRTGTILFLLYSLGGVFQSLSHVLNICHKVMGGSRPRPYGVLDSIWKAINGFILDTFVKPWVALVSEPVASAARGDSCVKTSFVLFGYGLRCLFCPVFGLLHFLTSITEGFANTLIGDFEQFTRVQERSELDKQKAYRSRGAGLEEGVPSASTAAPSSSAATPTRNIMGSSLVRSATSSAGGAGNKLHKRKTSGAKKSQLLPSIRENQPANLQLSSNAGKARKKVAFVDHDSELD
eukprot:GHVT01098240.1.p1 GENE.GHVT01098240.1~~GHVT01098240.1.p1  ORF type:complete len:823 (+),score=173.24 GHVT01098240.1:201-2471(+)